MYYFLVGYDIALKQPLSKHCAIIFNRNLLHTGLKQVASALMVVSRPNSLSHHNSKLLPGHCCGIPYLYTKPISCLTGEVYHSSNGALTDWDRIKPPAKGSGKSNFNEVLEDKPVPNS